MKIICLGDSQTFSYGLHRADKWTTLLGEATGFEVINAGINGDTSGGMLARLRYDVIDQKPDVVMVMGGGNDFIMGCSLEIVKANFMAIVQQCLAAKIRVFAASELLVYPELVNPEYKKLADFDEVNRKLYDFGRWLPDFCNTFPGVEFIDLQNQYLNAAEGGLKYSADGLHPTKEGAKIVAKILTNVFNVL